MGNLPEPLEIGYVMISSVNNPQMKKILQLNTKGRARRDSHAFVAEGLKMFLEAPGDWIEAVYVSESFLEKNGEYLEGVPFETVTDRVFSHITDTVTPQGILTVLKMPKYGLLDLLGGGKREPLLLTVENIQDPGNLGTMFRTAEGAGATGILMNKGTVDVFHPKTIRSTMGSVYRVPFLYTENLPETVRELQEKGLCFYAAHLRGSNSYERADYKRPSAFLIGNEANGLSEELAELADSLIRIPMEGRLESLNAAMAAGILLYEGNRQRRSE